MWMYDKKLEYPIKIKKPDPRMANSIITQYGGPDGELGASVRYLSQRFSMITPEAKATLNDIGTEELAHLEMVGAMVRQLLENASIEDIKKSGAAGYYADHDKAVYPVSAAGVPFTAAALQSKGDPITDLYENMAAEQKARSTYEYLINLADDPDVIDPLKFLREREIVHFQRFGEALRIVQDYLQNKKKYSMPNMPNMPNMSGMKGANDMKKQESVKAAMAPHLPILQKREPNLVPGMNDSGMYNVPGTSGMTNQTMPGRMTPSSPVMPGLPIMPQTMPMQDPGMQNMNKVPNDPGMNMRNMNRMPNSGGGQMAMQRMPSPTMPIPAAPVQNPPTQNPGSMPNDPGMNMRNMNRMPNSGGAQMAMQMRPMPSRPTPTMPMQTMPMQTMPMQTMPMQTTPMQNTPTQNPNSMPNDPGMNMRNMNRMPNSGGAQMAMQMRPMPSKPMQTMPMQTTPMQTTPMQTAPMQNPPVQNPNSMPNDPGMNMRNMNRMPNSGGGQMAMQMRPMPSRPMPTMPMQTMPMQTMPMQTTPMQNTPTQNPNSMPNDPGMNMRNMNRMPNSGGGQMAMQMRPMPAMPMQTAPMQTTPMPPMQNTATPNSVPNDPGAVNMNGMTWTQKLQNVRDMGNMMRG